MAIDDGFRQRGTLADELFAAAVEQGFARIIAF